MTKAHTQSINQSKSKWFINTVYTISCRSYENLKLFAQNCIRITDLNITVQFIPIINSPVYSIHKTVKTSYGKVQSCKTKF